MTTVYAVAPCAASEIATVAPAWESFRGSWCSAHGALFEADSGRCLGGPCRGIGLVPLPVEERDGLVMLKGRDA